MNKLYVALSIKAMAIVVTAYELIKKSGELHTLVDVIRESKQ